MNFSSTCIANCAFAAFQAIGGRFHLAVMLRNASQISLVAASLAQVRLDVARGHAPGIQGDDLLIETGKAPLVLRNQRRLEAPWRSRGIDSSSLALSVSTVFALAPLRKLPAACSLS